MYRRSLQRLGCRRGGPSLMRPSSPLLCTFQPNLTSMTNQVNRNEHHKKFGGSVSMGIPRISRLQVRSIAVLHETPRVMVVGRNYSNGFANNQFLIVNKQNNECIFIDACDDWPDDWVAFLSASKLTPTHVFLTHCHVDNVINLNALMSIVEQHMGLQLGIMWCQAELPWVQEFHRACERYGRMEEARQSLPMLRSNLYSYYTYAHQLHNKQRALHSQMKESTSSNGEISTPPLPQLVRQKDILLTCGTNRATSFYEFGDHNVLHYIFTPGHSPGHMMLSLPREKLLFTGDVLFYNQVGRVDLPWAVGERLSESLLALEDFPDSTVLLPGHGRLTTLGRERRENMALRSLYERREMGQQEVSVGFNAGYL